MCSGGCGRVPCCFSQACLTSGTFPKSPGYPASENLLLWNLLTVESSCLVFIWQGSYLLHVPCLSRCRRHAYFPSADMGNLLPACPFPAYLNRIESNIASPKMSSTTLPSASDLSLRMPPTRASMLCALPRDRTVRGSFARGQMLESQSLSKALTRSGNECCINSR